jgi:hypothetical protein
MEKNNRPVKNVGGDVLSVLSSEQVEILRTAGPDRVRDRLCDLMATGRLRSSTALGRGLDLIRLARREV